MISFRLSMARSINRYFVCVLVFFHGCVFQLENLSCHYNVVSTFWMFITTYYIPQNSPAVHSAEPDGQACPPCLFSRRQTWFSTKRTFNPHGSPEGIQPHKIMKNMLWKRSCSGGVYSSTISFRMSQWKSTAMLWKWRKAVTNYGEILNNSIYYAGGPAISLLTSVLNFEVSIFKAEHLDKLLISDEKNVSIWMKIKLLRRKVGSLFPCRDFRRTGYSLKAASEFPSL